jgi:glycine cleavage system H protein
MACRASYWGPMTSDSSFHVPTDRHYDRTHHLWAKGDPPRPVRVGIDSMGLWSLGDLAYVSLREVGTTVQRGQPIGTLEAAKMATSISSPISGTIAACNEAVLADPLGVNADPYGAGWLVEIEPSAWQDEARALVSGPDIEEWVAAEARRLRSESD